MYCLQVQGVFFRKFTVAKAQALHLVGWCANTQRGTVVGEFQGKPQALEEMKVGVSPQALLESCMLGGGVKGASQDDTQPAVS